MAARKNRGVNELPESWKEKIRASALINRLMDCAMGELEMSQQQIKSAEILLRKVIPDLNKTDIQPLGKDGQPTDLADQVSKMPKDQAYKAFIDGKV